MNCYKNNAGLFPIDKNKHGERPINKIACLKFYHGNQPV